MTGRFVKQMQGSLLAFQWNLNNIWSWHIIITIKLTHFLKYSSVRSGTNRDSEQHNFSASMYIKSVRYLYYY